MRSIFTIILFSISMISFAQISLSIDGEEASDGQVFTYNHVGGTASDMVFVVTNEGSSETWANVEIMEINNNAAGTNLQFCWNLCYTSIQVGDIYPTSPEHLNPGESTPPVGNHFVNEYEGDDPNEPVSYVFKFQEVNESGDVVGNTITITYIYDPTTGIDDAFFSNTRIYPVPVQDVLHVQTDQNIQASLFDATGRLIQSAAFPAGENTMNVESLKTGSLYFLQLTDGEGHSTTQKIIK